MTPFAQTKLNFSLVRKNINVGILHKRGARKFGQRKFVLIWNLFDYIFSVGHILRTKYFGSCVNISNCRSKQSGVSVQENLKFLWHFFGKMSAGVTNKLLSLGLKSIFHPIAYCKLHWKLACTFNQFTLSFLFARNFRNSPSIMNQSWRYIWLLVYLEERKYQ